MGQSADDVKLEEIDETKQIQAQTALSSFNFELNNLIDSTSSNENYAFSPLGASCALAMFAEGADGTTREQIVNALGFGGFSLNEMGSFFKKLLSSQYEGTDKKFKTLNSTWLDNEYSYWRKFTERCSYYYGATMASVNMSSSSTMDAINKWINTNTGGLFNRYFDGPVGCAMAVINALEYKSAWTRPFFLDENGYMYRSG